MEAGKRLTNPTVIRQYIYVRGYWDFEFFARYFFPEHCKYPFSRMHLDFCKAESDPERRGRREAIAAPRGNAKTTLKLLIKALHSIVYEYEPFILIMGHSAQEAENKVKDILIELETNPRLKKVFGALTAKKASKKEFVTRTGIKVIAKSRGQQVRGLKHGMHRPSLIICDDIESLEGVLTPEQRAKTREWFLKDVLKCGQLDGTTNVIVIGTCLHSESLLSELLQSSGWQGSRYQSIISYAVNQGLWGEYQKILTDLSNPDRQGEAFAFYKAHEAVMLEGAQVLWPEGEPYEYLQRLMIHEGKASFNSEKQNEPHDPERQLFDMQRARRFKLETEGRRILGLRWLDGSNKLVRPDQLVKIIAFHDPAMGQKPAQSRPPDFSAIVVMVQDRDGYLYCLDAYIERDTPKIQVQQAFNLHDKWGFETLYFEDNASQALMKQIYTDALEKEGKGRLLRVVGVHQTEDKYKRISTLEPDISNGYLLFNETLNPRLIDQLVAFPTTYDDGPDALHGAVRQLKKRLGSVTVTQRGHFLT